MNDPLLEHLQASLSDSYRIERELGGGGMGRVFVAEEKTLERKVVVKVLPPELGRGLSAERFRREIQSADAWLASYEAFGWNTYARARIAAARGDPAHAGYPVTAGALGRHAVPGRCPSPSSGVLSVARLPGV